MKKHLRLASAGILAILLVFVGLLFAEPKTKPYKAPSVSFKVDKKNVKLSTLKDNVVLVVFGTAGSKKDGEYSAAVSEVLEARKDKAIKAYHVNFFQSSKNTKEYYKKTPLSFPNITDSKGKISDKFKVTHVPCLFVIDKFEMVRHIGPAEKESLGTLVDSLLGEEEAGKSFSADPGSVFTKGECIAPLEVKTLRNKKLNIYSVLCKSRFTFVVFTQVD